MQSYLFSIQNGHKVGWAIYHLKLILTNQDNVIFHRYYHFLISLKLSLSQLTWTHHFSADFRGLIVLYTVFRHDARRLWSTINCTRIKCFNVDQKARCDDRGTYTSFFHLLESRCRCCCCCNNFSELGGTLSCIISIRPCYAFI